MRLPHLAILILATLGCRTLAREDFTPDTLLSYKRVGDIVLRLHVFHPAERRGGELRPAIVFFFGGGWKRGSPKQFYPHCAYLASRGMVAMSAEYRVEEKHGATPRDCVEDGRSAVRWIRAHAAELGIDPDRLVAGGGSAGGHVAAMTGLAEEVNGPEDEAFIRSRPNALVLFNPILDTGPETSVYPRVRSYWREVSPRHNIDGQAPPMTIFLGTEDRLISVSAAREFKERVEAAGGRCDLHLYQGQVHGFFNFSRGREFFTATVAETDRFLQSLGYLSEMSPVAVDVWLQKRESR